MSKLSTVLLNYFAIPISLIIGVVAPNQLLASPVENSVDTLGILGTVNIAYGDHTINSTISSGAELDVYQFLGTAGDSVSIAVTGSTYGFDPRIEVRDSSGALLNDQNCNTNATCSVTAITSLPSTGAYTATVSDLGLNNTGDYTMHVDQYPPVSNWLKVGYDSPISEELGHFSDFDVYAFDAVAGSLVRVTVQGATYGLDMLLAAFSPESTILDSASCNTNATCSTFLDLNITETGLHSFLIADLGNNNTGNYDFSVTCLSANCDVIPVPPAPVMAAAVLPSSRSVQVGSVATAFATIINTGSTTATDCGIAPLTSVQANFSYQITDGNNALIGVSDTPIDIAAGGNQSYVFAFTPTASFSAVDVQFTFECTNTSPAAVTVGLNTLLLVADTDPVPDIVALSATLTGDGIVNLASTGVFAVATVNVGSAGTITVSADTGSASLPVSIALCETNPATGVCIHPTVPALEPVTTFIEANTTPTFAFFVTGTDTVPFDPANNRIFVRFKDAGGVTRGSTSVAVRTLQ